MKDENKQPSIRKEIKGASTSRFSGGFEYHIVFSTGCSVYQDWQSYLFFFQAMRIQQPGTVTRIVSGCEDSETEQKLQDLFDEQIKPMNPTNFRIHFTPDYSRIKEGRPFVYFNKPFGMKHWLENALGFPDSPVNPEAIVILLDPDQLILRRFTNNDFNNTQWKFISNDQEPYIKIEHGKPMGQLYGFGLQFHDKVDIDKLAPNSPIKKLTRKQLQAGYIVGPPYVATAADMYKIVKQWCAFAVPVHDQYPFLLAEMFAYCLAAAHVELPHQTAASFMISDLGAGRAEGWDYIDVLGEENLCGGYTEAQVPNVLHFCQRYGLGKYFFGKRKIPDDFLSCESPLLREPSMDELKKYDFAWFPAGNKKNWDPVLKKRNAFVLCRMIPALNAAATFYKQNHCAKETANFEKSLIFFDSLDVSSGK
jgi:hypothetical protein